MKEKKRYYGKIIESFNCALEGVIYVIRTERHFRIHILCAIGILILSLFFNLERLEIIIIFITISFVFVSEMFNTVVEHLVNLVTETYHPLARIAKDIAAGAVFFATVNALIVGYLIFFRDKYLGGEFKETVISRVSHQPEYIMVIALAMLILLVLMGKIYSGRGKPFYGGMPSMHAALAFGIATATVFIIHNVFLILLILLLASMVGHSRIQLGAHSVPEVIAGGFLGILVTAFLFVFFRWLLL